MATLIDKIIDKTPSNIFFPVVMACVGSFFVFLGCCEVSFNKGFTFNTRETIEFIQIIIGIIPICFSLLIVFFESTTIGWLGRGKIRENGTVYTANIAETELNILFGKIDVLSRDSEESMVVLPANEFFDDACIRDKRSALGAYVSQRFINQDKQIEELIAAQLKSCPSVEVEKEAGVRQKSYGVGEGVFLKEPLGAKQPVLLLAVTTKRAGEGLRSEMSYIFQAVKKIHQIAADNRITSVYIPIMGSGHGGLKKEMALFALLLAICDTVSKPTGHHLGTVNIVVFQPDEKAEPSISRSNAKKLLKISTGMFG